MYKQCLHCFDGWCYQQLTLQVLVAQGSVPQEWIHSLFPGVRTVLKCVQARNACLQSSKHLADDKMDRVAVEWDTVSSLSLDDQSSKHLADDRVLGVLALAGSSGCWMRHYVHIISWWSQCLLRHDLSAQSVSSAVSSPLGCNTSAQLWCAKSAQLLSEGSVASCQLSCQLSCNLSAQLHPVSSDESCHFSCNMLAEL